MIEDIKKLRHALADLKASGKAALDEYNTLSAGLAAADAKASAADQAKLAALEKQIDKLEADCEKAAADLERAEKQLKRDKLFAPLAASPPASTISAYGRITAHSLDPAQTHDFANIAEFACAVHVADTGGAIDQRLNYRAAAPTNPHQERGGSASEGYLVPPQFSTNIWELVFGEIDLLTMADTEPTVANHVKLVTDETTPWGASGVKAIYRKELAALTATKEKFNPVGVDVHAMYAFVEASDELLADAPRLADRLSRKAAAAIRWRASEALMRGDGVGEPQGYLSSNALVTVAKESAQPAATIVAANVAKMFSRLLGGSIAGSAWLVNSDTFPQLMTMTLGTQPIWTPPASGFQSAPGGFLLGRPVIPTEHADTVGAVGDIQLVDMKGYYHTLRQSIEFAQSMHLYFDRGAQAFRWTFRHGGRPYLSAPVSPNKGAATKSHFVALATRA